MKLSDRVVLLYCFPPAGGSAEMFCGWQSAMPSGVVVRAVERPGRGERHDERPLTGYAVLSDILAAEVAADIRRERLHAPVVEYAFFGFGEGAPLGFSVCARVEQMLGQAPVLGMVCGGLPPHVARQRLSNLPDPALAEWVLRTVGGGAAAASEFADFRSCFLPLLRADLRVDEGAAIDAGISIAMPLMLLLPAGAAVASLRREWGVCSSLGVRAVRADRADAAKGDEDIAWAGLPELVADVLDTPVPPLPVATAHDCWREPMAI